MCYSKMLDHYFKRFDLIEGSYYLFVENCVKIMGNI